MYLQLSYGGREDFDCSVEWLGDFWAFRQDDAYIAFSTQTCGRLCYFLREVVSQNLGDGADIIEGIILPEGTFRDGEKQNSITAELISDAPEDSEERLNCILISEKGGDAVRFHRYEAGFLLDVMEGDLKRGMFKKLEIGLKKCHSPIYHIKDPLTTTLI